MQAGLESNPNYKKKNKQTSPISKATNNLHQTGQITNHEHDSTSKDSQFERPEECSFLFSW